MVRSEAEPSALYFTAYRERLDRSGRGFHGVERPAGKNEVRLARKRGAEGMRGEGGETAGRGGGGHEAASGKRQCPDLQ
jgi:hypothetical protein